MVLILYVLFQFSSSEEVQISVSYLNLSSTLFIVLQGPHVAHGFRMKQLAFMAVVCLAMLFIVYRTTNYQYQRTEVLYSLVWLITIHSARSKKQSFAMFLPLPEFCA